MTIDPRAKKLLLAVGGFAALHLLTYVKRRRKFDGEIYLLNEVVFKKPGQPINLLKERLKAYELASKEGMYRYRLVKGKKGKPHRFYIRKGPKWALKTTPGIRKMNLGNRSRWSSAIFGIVGGLAVARWIAKRV